MRLMHAALVTAATVALVGSAFAKERELNCPQAASEQRMSLLESQIDALQGQLDGLDARLDQLADAREQALDRARERIETAAHSRASPDQVDAEVAKALAQAQADSEATAHDARAVHRSMDLVRVRIDSLREEMKTLAARHAQKGSNEG
jgi:chromosome segregation ATPase